MTLMERDRNAPQVWRGDLPVTERVHQQMLALPAFPRASKNLLKQYIQAFRKVVENSDEVRKIKETKIEKKSDMG